MMYVMSDIHGNSRRFDSILKQIRLQPEDTLYILGDVIDRHPDGIRLLRRIMAMENARLLLGNHEYMMLRALGVPYDDNGDDGGAMAHWYRNGGKVTHDHWKHLRKQLRQEIVEYLRSLPLNLDVQAGEKRYRLVHGAPVESRNRDPKYKSDAHYAVWMRLEGHEEFCKDAVLIFGHTPTRYYADKAPMEIWFGPGKIGIDCGGGYPESGENSAYGRLACLRLDDGKIFYSEEDTHEI